MLETTGSLKTYYFFQTQSQSLLSVSGMQFGLNPDLVSIPCNFLCTSHCAATPPHPPPHPHPGHALGFGQIFTHPHKGLWQTISVPLSDPESLFNHPWDLTEPFKPSEGILTDNPLGLHIDWCIIIRFYGFPRGSINVKRVSFYPSIHPWARTAIRT